MKKRNDFQCECCGSPLVNEIVYGLALPDIEADYPGRQIILGGCVVAATSPKWQCRSCGYTWGRAVIDENMDGESPSAPPE